MTPKEALIKDGFPGVKPGRGRLSREAIERCKVLAGQGQRIDGYVVSSTPALAAKSTATPVVNKVAVTNEKTVAELSPLRYDERLWKAVSESGKEFGMREVCRTCGNSLTYHVCDRPMPLGVSVKIVSRG